MPAYGLIIIACWLIFIGYWIVSAFTAKVAVERGSFASTLLYRIPLTIGAFMIGTFRLWRPPMTMSITPDFEATRWAGALVCVAGLAFAIWARRILGSNWSSNVQFKEGHQLIRRGPYRFVRHPIYTGILVMISAPAIQFGRLHFWLGFVVFGFGLWIKLKQEEVVMMKHFPEYSEYRKQVKAIVPFII